MDSPLATISVDDLLPPYVLESPTQTLLDLKSVKHSLTFASDAVLEPSDRISVKWQGAPGTPAEGSYTSGFVDVGGKRPFELLIAPSLAAINQGQTVTLTYDIIRGNSPPVTSQPLILYVLPLAQADLPRVFIEQADETGQGLNLFVEDLPQFTLHINAWLLINQGDFFWARLKGINANDSVFDQQYWKAPDNLVGPEFFRLGFFAQTFAAAPLKGLKDRSVLTVEFAASVNRSQDEVEAVRFAPRHYIVRTGAPPLPGKPAIVSVTDSFGQAIADGGDTFDTRVTVSGTANAGEQVEVFDGTDSRGPARAESGTWNLLLSGLTVGEHPFTAKALYGGGEISDRRTIIVIPTPRAQLSVEEAPDNISLDPLRAVATLTAMLDYDMQPTDMVSVTVTAAVGTPAAGSHTTTPVAAGNTRPRKIALPVALVAFSIGKTMDVTFTYSRGNSAPVTSPPLRLNVLPIALDRLDAPVITQADGSDILDLNDVQTGANLLFGLWLHGAVNQRLWLDLEGESASGPHNLSIWQGHRNAVHRAWVTAGGFNQFVSPDYFRLLKNGSRLTVRLRVNLDQVSDLATATVFQTREYTIRAMS